MNDNISTRIEQKTTYTVGRKFSNTLISERKCLCHDKMTIMIENFAIFQLSLTVRQYIYPD